MANEFADVFPGATAHAPTRNSNSFDFEANYSTKGNVVQVGYGTEHLKINRLVGVERHLDMNKHPSLPQSLRGWDNPKKKVDPFSYIRHVVNLGFSHGLKLFPTEIPLKKQSLVQKLSLASSSGNVGL